MLPNIYLFFSKYLKTCNFIFNNLTKKKKDIRIEIKPNIFCQLFKPPQLQTTMIKKYNKNMKVPPLLHRFLNHMALDMQPGSAFYKVCEQSSLHNLSISFKIHVFTSTQTLGIISPRKPFQSLANISLVIFINVLPCGSLFCVAIYCLLMCFCNKINIYLNQRLNYFSLSQFLTLV